MAPDVNKPVENPKLSALLKEYATAEGARLNELHELIAEEFALNAWLLAVICFDDENIKNQSDGTVQFKKDTIIAFDMLEHTNGTVFLPLYTDWIELGKNEKYKSSAPKTLIVSFDDAAAIAAGKKGIVINPFSDNFVIPPNHVVHMKQHKDIITKGHATEVIQKETVVQIGEPAEYPHAMVESIRNYAKSDKTINAIWLKLMIKEGERSYLLVVDHKGVQESVFGGIAEAAKPFLDNGMYIDMVPLESDIGKKAAHGDPVYKRKKGLFGLL